MKSENMQIAQTILEQLGGRQFLMMTGSTNLTAIDKGLGMLIKRNKSGANVFRVILDEGADLYDVEFVKSSPARYDMIKRIEGVYCDMLQDIFEEETGLYVTLNKR